MRVADAMRRCNPIGLCGGCHRVRDQHHGGTVLPCLRNQSLHHHCSGGRIEIASGFIGQQQCGAVHQRTCNGYVAAVRH